ncbi:DUF2771 family protein, partial [Kibdelosporangium lantanae]
ASRNLSGVRRYVIASLVTGALVLAGCTPDLPEVTFFADGTTVRLSPADGNNCHPDLDVCDATGRLTVPAGKFVNISVPSQVAKAAWVVVFKYKGADGNEQQARTNVFSPEEKRYAYTLTPPTAADQLTHVEVRQFSGMALDPNQEIQYLTTSWALDVTP